jgi:hypothetical protein
MYPNLEAEFKRQKIRRVDIASDLGIAISTMSEKMLGKSEFTLRMASDIKKLLGVDMPLEVLFKRDKATA